MFRTILVLSALLVACGGKDPADAGNPCCPGAISSTPGPYQNTTQCVCPNGKVLIYFPMTCAQQADSFAYSCG
jgi:hypothetical protein